MAEKAHVASIEALELFRARLIVFVSKALNSTAEASEEVRRTRLWLQNDQRLHWEAEIRRRRRELDRAEQELLSARLSSLRDNLSGQRNAVRKAKDAIAEAEGKLRNVKGWTRNFEAAVDPLLRRLESLRALLENEMPKAIAWLVQTIRILEGYAESPFPGAGPARPQEADEQVESAETADTQGGEQS